jgi:glycosyltransferase involved in cell wall biosynthesis
MAAGRPILGNRVGDLGRIVLETGCGLLVDPVSPPAIRQAIRELADPELRARLGAAGQQAARKEYNWTVVKGRLGKVYDVLRGKSSV